MLALLTADACDAIRSVDCTHINLNPAIDSWPTE
jgi:hypothetical protein